MFDTIHHIAIIGSDYDKSKHFYVDLRQDCGIIGRHPPQKPEQHTANGFCGGFFVGYLRLD